LTKRNLQVLSELQELAALTLDIQITKDKKVFGILLELLRMGVEPSALFQTLKGLTSSSGAAGSIRSGASSPVGSFRSPVHSCGSSPRAVRREKVGAIVGQGSGTALVGVNGHGQDHLESETPIAHSPKLKKRVQDDKVETTTSSSTTRISKDVRFTSQESLHECKGKEKGKEKEDNRLAYRGSSSVDSIRSNPNNKLDKVGVGKTIMCNTGAASAIAFNAGKFGKRWQYEEEYQSNVV
jgi:hypothetical protein